MTKHPSPALPPRDAAKGATEQGLFDKFKVYRTDGSDRPGGKHEGCEYFVLDVVHDAMAKPALAAYANAVEASHPQLAADMRGRYTLDDADTTADQLDAAQARSELLAGLLREVSACFTREDDLPDNLLPRIDAALAEETA
jgi:hypothetical protein